MGVTLSGSVQSAKVDEEDCTILLRITPTHLVAFDFAQCVHEAITNFHSKLGSRRELNVQDGGYGRKSTFVVFFIFFISTKGGYAPQDLKT